MNDNKIYVYKALRPFDLPWIVQKNGKVVFRASTFDYAMAHVRYMLDPDRATEFRWVAESLTRGD